MLTDKEALGLAMLMNVSVASARLYMEARLNQKARKPGIVLKTGWDNERWKAFRYLKNSGWLVERKKLVGGDPAFDAKPLAFEGKNPKTVDFLADIIHSD